MRGFLWFLLIAVLGAASVIKPEFSAHQKMIYEMSTGSEAPSATELAALPEWKELTFRDFYLVTATQSKGRQTIVSYGFFRYIKVMDKEWWTNPFGRKPASAD
jgi:hypothetical protein